jgi:hypothetical protein
MEHFSVFQFLPDDVYEQYKSRVTLEEAVKAAHFLTHNVAARVGITRRVIIVDGGDCVCFEWIYGQGVVFPRPEDFQS